MLALRIAYAANILILVPIAVPTLLRRVDAAQGRIVSIWPWLIPWRHLLGSG